ncbi:hypothetical protein MUN89_18840 [Halobacillus salinarum]|uniref:Uncharacterized protein n=1 Tax=Halobacillus salinarum TaxID=2932257 RepID=A0ABY4EJV6_9BACI|nr:hypothetical protein [Halobacillus salinarum]UOQ43904.1 hypothetical protein MUN89_18840 [Halobacillus salinarum]
MNSIYYLIIAILCAAALIGTLWIARRVLNREEKSKEEEVKSLVEADKHSSIPLLTLIYAITFLIIVILFWVFVF